MSCSAIFVFPGQGSQHLNMLSKGRIYDSALSSDHSDVVNYCSDLIENDVIKLTDLKRSMGVGIRLYMPMLGVLGYDIGYGFDSTIIDDGDAHGWEHHFVFGMPIN